MRQIQWKKFKLRLKKRDLLILLGVAFGGGLVLLSIYTYSLHTIVAERFEGNRWNHPSKIYSDSFILYPGQDIEGIHLVDRLTRLGYREVATPPKSQGEFHLGPDTVQIYLHDFSYPDQDFEGFPILMTLHQGKITEIKNQREDRSLALVELEPELIAAIYNGTWEERNLLQLNEVSPHLIIAVLAVEDSRFYEHRGVDPWSVARAIWVNLKSGAIVQGGSTLTQQLVKNFYLNQERTLVRKINEAMMALLLEMEYSKDEILEAYLNEIYMGQNGMMGIYGIGEAARFYFGKRPLYLTLGESALLAGVINSPNLFSPFEHPERAAERKTHVLERMRKLNMIPHRSFLQAMREEIPDHSPIAQRREAPYFVDFVRQELGKNYHPSVLASQGLRIFTSLDMQYQKKVEESLQSGLKRLEDHYPSLLREEPSDRLQGSVVVLQPQTGYIKAMVGGRDYSETQFNRVTQAKRQPGSLFKLFVYAAAISQEASSGGSPYTPASLLDDSPFILVSGETTWRPQNYDRNFHGTVTLRTAIEKSLNVATAKLAQEIGIDRVADIAEASGIKSPLARVPSLALGTSEVVPLEMATAYGTIANGGVRVDPLAIKEVVDSEGKVLERRTLEMSQVFTPQQAYLLTHLLTGVVENGTAKSLRRSGLTIPIAGKTGTSSHYRDAWFVGYTTDLLGLVWVGFDQEGSEKEEGRGGHSETVHLTGAQAAIPIWTDVMKDITTDNPSEEFMIPPGIIFREIDPETGLLSTLGCPGGIREAFIKGTEPTQSCLRSTRAPRGILQWVRELFSN